jgi:hypothetical protein
MRANRACRTKSSRNGPRADKPVLTEDPLPIRLHGVMTVSRATLASFPPLAAHLSSTSPYRHGENRSGLSYLELLTAGRRPGGLDRLTKLRDNAERVQAGLDYATQFPRSLQAELPSVEQSFDAWVNVGQRDQNGILRARQRIIRALCGRVDVPCDGRIGLCWSNRISISGRSCRSRGGDDRDR